VRRSVLALFALALAAQPAHAADDAVRVQADGAVPLPPRKPGQGPASAPDAATLRTQRQAAVARGIENAVLEYAAGVAREEARHDEAALRSALGTLSAYALGHGVLADLGVREPKPRPGAKSVPRRPDAPIPQERAWRVEAVVDGARVRAALQAAGLALVSGADGGARVVLVLEAPFDGPALSALRARVGEIGATQVVPRRFEAERITLVVSGLPADVVARRLASDPPAGFRAETSVLEAEEPSISVRLHPERAPAGAGARPRGR
jgi:hypothetical protein